MRASLQRSAAALFAALIAFGSAPALAGQAADTIRYGVDDQGNVNELPQAVAQQQGLFAREGVNVQIVRFASAFRTAAGVPPPAGASPGTVREAMDAGRVDMTRQQLAMLINDAVTGRVRGNYLGVSLAVRNPVYFLIVRPEIRSYADLRGKTITATGPHDAITLWTEELILQNGLRKDDFMVRSIASTEARFACLRSGECVAAPMAQPAAFEAMDAGFRSIGITNEIPLLLYQFDIVNPAWARMHRDAVVKYIRAITAANRYIMDPRNRDAVVRLTMAHMSLPEPRARQVLSYIWDPKNRVLAERPELDMNNVRATIALFEKYGLARGALPPAERFADPSYVQAAAQ